MAEGNNHTGAILSLLDRLTEKKAPLSVMEEMRELKASLCRDLSALLNTRRAEKDFDSSYEESTNSLLTFGVSDFTSYNLKNAIEQERVRRSIERAIRQFEPRLARVTVTLDEPDPLRPVLQFQISAVLQAVDTGEPVLFNATLHRASRQIAVSGAAS